MQLRWNLNMRYCCKCDVSPMLFLGVYQTACLCLEIHYVLFWRLFTSWFLSIMFLWYAIENGGSSIAELISWEPGQTQTKSLNTIHLALKLALSWSYSPGTTLLTPFKACGNMPFKLEQPLNSIWSRLSWQLKGCIVTI